MTRPVRHLDDVGITALVDYLDVLASGRESWSRTGGELGMAAASEAHLLRGVIDVVVGLVDDCDVRSEVTP